MPSAARGGRALIRAVGLHPNATLAAAIAAPLLLTAWGVRVAGLALLALIGVSGWASRGPAPSPGRPDERHGGADGDERGRHQEIRRQVGRGAPGEVVRP